LIHTVGPQIFKRRNISQITNWFWHSTIQIVAEDEHCVEILQMAQLGWHCSCELILINDEFTKALHVTHRRWDLAFELVVVQVQVGCRSFYKQKEKS